MWKLILIYMTRNEIIECTELRARQMFDMCEYNPFVMYGFLYNSKGLLEETYINSQTKRNNQK